MANEICFVRGDTCDRYITSIKRRSDGGEYDLKDTDKIIVSVKNGSGCEPLIAKVITPDMAADKGIPLHFAPSDTAELECRTYLYDVRLICANTPEDDVYTIIPESDFKICRNISEVDDYERLHDGGA